MRILSILFIMTSMVACASIDTVYESGKAIVGGVTKDVTDITTGALDTVSGVVKDVSEKATSANE